jgi:hypothetical protein
MPKTSRSRGMRGRPGATGTRGARGRTGPPGMTGISATRADILAVVQDEFSEVRKQFAIQIERTGQMQLQLDIIQGLLKQLLART